MKIHILAAAAAAGAFALSAQADTTWWSEAFTLTDYPAGIDSLTNNAASGTWEIEEGDSSVLVAAHPADDVAHQDVLKLDTQGGDLTFTPTNATGTSKVLVDADIYFVGSDQPPSAAEFDAASDVQAAVYLKHETVNEGTEQEEEVSTLCIYAQDSEGAANWIELDSTVANESWAHIQIAVDYSSGMAGFQVFVDGTQAAAKADPTKTSWYLANNYDSATELSSISFRGTGAVDNFVGKFQEEAASYWFSAVAYVDGVESLDDEIDEVEAQVGTPASFEVPLYSAADNKPLSKIVVKSFAIGGSDTEYTFEEDNGTWSVDPDDGNIDIQAEYDIVMVDAPTDGAEADSLLIEVYYGEAAAPADPDPVDPGDSLSAADLAAGIVPAGVVTLVDPNTQEESTVFEVNFRAPAAGITYQLVASSTLEVADWTDVTEAAPVGDPVVSTAAGELITLDAPFVGDVKFFKIKASN